MNILGLIKEYFGDVSIITVLILTVIQLAPIKVDPWSLLADKIGKAFNKSLINEIREEEKRSVEEIKKVKDSINERDKKIDFNEENRIKADEELQRKMNIREAKRLRAEILDFASRVRNDNKPHFKSEFQHIMEDYDAYEELIEKLGMTNGYTDMEMEVIKNKYLEQYGEDYESTKK